jgi:hypothetical protein
MVAQMKKSKQQRLRFGDALEIQDSIYKRIYYLIFSVKWDDKNTTM